MRRGLYSKIVAKTIVESKMSDEEQINALVRELEAVVTRFRVEFDMKIAATIGVLEIIKLDLYSEIRDGMGNEDDNSTPSTR